jgi:hypothetical protein
MDDNELLDYLDDLKKKYSKLEMENFWVMADSSTFRPIKVDSVGIKKKLASKPEHYAGKRVASIDIFIDNTKKAIVTNDSLIDLCIQVYQIQEGGKIKTSGGIKTLLVLFFREDLDQHKFRTKDVERFLKLCREGTLKSDVINGIPFDILMKKLEKKGIDFMEL